MRELDPALFSQPTASPQGPSQATVKTMPVSEAKQGFVNLEIREIKEAHRRAQAKIHELEAKLEQVTQSFKEFQEVSLMRDDRLHQSTLKLEKAFYDSQRETAQFSQEVATRLKERRVAEHRVEEMLERHNSVIQTYESRLVALQKLYSEKEAEQHHFLAIIRELRAELQKSRGPSLGAR